MKEQQKQFEKWYGDNYSEYALKSWNSTEYGNLDTQLAWNSWQASLAAQQAPQPKGGEHETI